MFLLSKCDSVHVLYTNMRTENNGGGSVYVYTVYNSATVHAINVEGEDVWTSLLGGRADGGGDAQDGASHLG